MTERTDVAVIAERFALTFTRRDPVLTDAHVVELRVAGTAPIHLTREEARVLVRRLNGFLEGTR